jgi:hypothetical protein
MELALFVLIVATSAALILPSFLGVFLDPEQFKGRPVPSRFAPYKGARSIWFAALAAQAAPPKSFFLTTSTSGFALSSWAIYFLIASCSSANARVIQRSSNHRR